LIAMPHLADPHFFHSVTYVCEHNEEGTLGFIINQSVGISVADILEQMLIDNEDDDLKFRPVLAGGPIQMEQGFVLHQDAKHWESSLDLKSDIIVTASKDILESIAHRKGPKENLIVLGYSGWDAGQLDEEIAQNFWLTCPADPKIIFDTPVEERWEAAAALVGITDLKNLSDQPGHA